MPVTPAPAPLHHPEREVPEFVEETLVPGEVGWGEHSSMI